MQEADHLDDPIGRLERWLADARDLSDTPQAMTLATVGRGGSPSARVVLLRGYDGRGLTFFTNRGSRKGVELEATPQAALVLHWPELGRQARVEGAVEETSEEESLAYWRTRPRASQLSAWASPQSRPVADRAELDARVADVSERFTDREIPLPPFWGGYRVVPETIELWTHRDDRLHDRIRYVRAPGGWRRERLAP